MSTKMLYLLCFGCKLLALTTKTEFLKNELHQTGKCYMCVVSFNKLDPLTIPKPRFIKYPNIHHQIFIRTRNIPKKKRINGYRNGSLLK